MQTILRAYEFDVSTDAGKAAWSAFKEERAKGPRCFGPALHPMTETLALDGVTVELETKHLFNNQWNATASGKTWRVFDWFLQAHSYNGAKNLAPSNIRRGHYLVQTDEMREIRRNIARCGYCGKQEPAAKGYVFCPHCLDSEYLTEANLFLARMRSVDDDSEFAPLTKAESAYLLPLYRQAQIHGNSERGKAKLTALRASINGDAKRAILAATLERDGLLWLIDHGINTDNVLFYKSRCRFSFGWRKPLSAGEVDTLQAALGSEFSFPYEIKTESGRTIESGTAVEE